MWNRFKAWIDIIVKSNNRLPDYQEAGFLVLFQIFIKEALQFIKRNNICTVIQIGMDGTGNTIPESDKWGVVMRRDSPLAEKSELTFEDIYGLPLFASEQSIKADFPRWCGENAEKLNVAGTFNLAFNGSVFVREGLGYLLTFEHLIDTSEESGLCFCPIVPLLETKMYVIWKKYQIFSPIAELFLKKLKAEFEM